MKPKKQKTKKPTKLRFTVCIDEDLREWVERGSEEAERSMSSFVNIMLKRARRELSGLQVIEGEIEPRKANGGGK